MKKTVQDNVQIQNGELLKEQEEIRRENKKEDKKAFLPFVIMLFASAGVGALFGSFSIYAKDKGTEFVLEAVRRMLSASSPYVLAVCILITIFFGYVLFFRYRREYRQGVLNMTEEELNGLQDKIEYRLNFPLIITSVVTLIGFFEMSVVLVCMEKGNLPVTIAAVAEFAAVMALSIILQQKLINFEKEMNPGKRGSVFSVDFQKTWIDSCDEAEKSTIYEAAYFSYVVSNTVSIFLWVAVTFAGFAFDLGILPSAIIVFLWGVQIFAYNYKAAKAEKERYMGGGLRK